MKIEVEYAAFVFPKNYFLGEIFRMKDLHILSQFSLLSLKADNYKNLKY